MRAWAKATDVDDIEFEEREENWDEIDDSYDIIQVSML